MNHDGYPDLILFFRTQDLTALAASSVAAMSSSPRGGSKPPVGKPAPQEKEVVLYGKTYGGTPIRGADMVQVIMPPGHVGKPLLGSPTSIFRRTIRIQR